MYETGVKNATKEDKQHLIDAYNEGYSNAKEKFCKNKDA